MSLNDKKNCHQQEVLFRCNYVITAALSCKTRVEQGTAVLVPKESKYVKICRNEVNCCATPRLSNQSKGDNNSTLKCMPVIIYKRGNRMPTPTHYACFYRQLVCTNLF